MTEQHRIILVRQPGAQHGGGGCCSSLGGLVDEDEPEAGDWAGCDLTNRMGAVYRALRAELRGQVAIEMVDPHNTAWLLPAIWRDARRAGAGRRTAWLDVRSGTANGAVICDGRVLSTGVPPSPDQVVTRVLATLAA